MSLIIIWYCFLRVVIVQTYDLREKTGCVLGGLYCMHLFAFYCTHRPQLDVGGLRTIWVWWCSSDAELGRLQSSQARCDIAFLTDLAWEGGQYIHASDVSVNGAHFREGMSLLHDIIPRFHWWVRELNISHGHSLFEDITLLRRWR